MTVSTITAPSEFDALEKAGPNELIFPLLERDWAAPATIMFWVDQRRKAATAIMADKDYKKNRPELVEAVEKDLRQCADAEAIAMEMTARQKGQNAPVEVVRVAAGGDAPPSNDPKADALAKLRAEIAEADYHLNNAVELALLALCGDDAHALTIKGAWQMVHDTVMQLSPRHAKIKGRAMEVLPSPTPTMDLVRRAAAVSGVAYDDLVGPSRVDDIVRVRQATWFILKSRGLSWKQIGRRFNRDHSTVISGYRRAETLIADNASFRELVVGIGFAA